MFRVSCVLVFLALGGCATATKRGIVQVPVAVAQPGAWVESEGIRYPTPARVPIANTSGEHVLTIGSASHAPQQVTLAPEYQWQSLWLGPMGVAVDMASRSAWQLQEDKLQVDLDSAPWRRGDAPFEHTDEYQSGSRLRRIGQVGVVGGVLAALSGNVLVMSSVCYEECDDSSTSRLTTGLVLQSAAAVVLISSGIAWYRGARRRDRARRRSLLEQTW